MQSMKMHYALVGIFLLLVGGISAWSWVLVDPNFTLVKHADWSNFREFVVSIGYFQRQWSANVYTLLILSLTMISYCIVRWYKGSILPLLVSVGIVGGLLSYPALSHDLFNYIFDARIVTHYHANPYIHRALDFPADPMLRFMHWVHRTYPYGPTYMLISLIPSAVGSGIFSLTFFLFKGMHTALFFLAGWSLCRMDRKAALIFITSPLIIIEGLINTHNDFVALALAIVGIYLLQRKRTHSALFFFITSGLIKFISLPILVMGMVERIKTHSRAECCSYEIASPSSSDRFRLHRECTTSSTLRMTKRIAMTIKTLHKRVSSMRIISLIIPILQEVRPWHLAFGGIALLIVFLLTRQEIQPWYFLNLLIFLPFASDVFQKFTIASTGLLLSYYPYVLGGEWGQGGDVGMKRSIILYSLLLNVSVLFVVLVRKKLK